MLGEVSKEKPGCRAGWVLHIHDYVEQVKQHLLRQDRVFLVAWMQVDKLPHERRSSRYQALGPGQQELEHLHDNFDLLFLPVLYLHILLHHRNQAFRYAYGTVSLKDLCNADLFQELGLLFLLFSARVVVVMMSMRLPRAFIVFLGWATKVLRVRFREVGLLEVIHSGDVCNFALRAFPPEFSARKGVFLVRTLHILIDERQW